MIFWGICKEILCNFYFSDGIYGENPQQVLDAHVIIKVLFTKSDESAIIYVLILGEMYDAKIAKDLNSCICW